MLRKLKMEGEKNMKRNLVNYALVLVFAAIMSVSAMTVKAGNLASYVSMETNLTNFGEQDFVLVNRTGVEIYALYVTPHSAKQWGDDVLGIDTLYHNEFTTITFAPKTRATYWDLRIEDEEGNYIEWDKFNLKKISKIQLFYENGEATAIFE